jgi:hypothetical protein
MSIEDRYRIYIAQHRWILTEFVQLALARARAGERRLGAKHLVETLRAQHRPSPTGGDKFGICNSFATSLAKDAIAMAPELDGLFVFKGSPKKVESEFDFETAPSWIRRSPHHHLVAPGAVNPMGATAGALRLQRRSRSGTVWILKVGIRGLVGD